MWLYPSMVYNNKSYNNKVGEKMSRELKKLKKELKRLQDNNDDHIMQSEIEDAIKEIKENK